MAPASAPSDMAIGLKTLPVEVLIDICRHLCLHCRVPHVVVQSSEVIEAARTDQRTLASLSRTCKALQDVAQPVLFHYYHSGNIPKICEDDEFDDSEVKGECHQLIGFLGSILSRPDLAGSVKAFAVNPPYNVDFMYYAGSDIVGLALKASQKICPSALKSSCFVPCLKHPTQDWMAVFALPSATQYSTVCWPAEEGFSSLRDYPVTLPNITYLALSSWGRARCYHIYDTRYRVERMPNLEVLIAADCGALQYFNAQRKAKYHPWSTPLSRLRKLSVSSLDPTYLVTILGHCTVLEDLELFCDTEEEYSVLTLEHLLPVRQTLRRLCYSVTTPWMQIGDDENEVPSEDQWEDVEDEYNDDSEGYNTDSDGSTSLVSPDFGPFDASNYPNLEILEIEQMAIYGNIFGIGEQAQVFKDSAQTGSGTLISRLPVSMRIFHIGMVIGWRELRQDLIGFANEAPAWFPHLTIIQADIFQDANHSPPPGDEIKEVESILAAVGISFSVKPTPKSSSARGMLGPRPGEPEIVKVPAISFIPVPMVKAAGKRDSPLVVGRTREMD